MGTRGKLYLVMGDSKAGPSSVCRHILVVELNSLSLNCVGTGYITEWAGGLYTSSLESRMNDSLTRGGYHIREVGVALCSTLSIECMMRSSWLLPGRSYSTCTHTLYTSTVEY